jgi:DNA invertase Pin-like site-specific DNA recombinase
VTPAGTRIVGYCRCSTKGQAENGVSLEQQRQAILEAAERRGWTVVAILEEQVSGAAKSRPIRDAAIAMIEAGAADALVAAKLDRLTRSLVDFGALLERKVPIVVLDTDLDMTSPMGEMVANVLMTFAQFERKLIGQRTKDALAVKKQGGQRLGRPSAVPPAVVARIRRERAAGRRCRRSPPGSTRTPSPPSPAAKPGTRPRSGPSCSCQRRRHERQGSPGRVHRSRVRRRSRRRTPVDANGPAAPRAGGHRLRSSSRSLTSATSTRRRATRAGTSRRQTTSHSAHSVRGRFLREPALFAFPGLGRPGRMPAPGSPDADKAAAADCHRRM